MKKKITLILLTLCCIFSFVFGFGFLPNTQVQAASGEGMTFKAQTTFSTTKPLEVPPKTLEATVKLPAGYTERAGVVIGNWWDDSCDCFALEVHKNGEVRLLVIDANKTRTDVFFGNTSVATGNWTHIAVTVDGANATLYIDGAQISTKTYRCTDFTPTTVFTLGGDLRTGNGQYFKGQIKDVTLYADTRTASEIAQDRAGTIDLTDSNLLCRYDVSDAVNPLTINDLSGKGYTLYDTQANTLWITDGTITDPDPADYAYSFAVVGDTQKLVPHYANYLIKQADPENYKNNKDYDYDDHEYPENDTFKKLYDYIVDNAQSKKIAHVFGLGDITERASSWQWVIDGCPNAPDEEFTLAQEQLNRLGEAGLDYSLVRGNHETWESYNKYFGTGAESSKSNYTADEVYVHPDGTIDYTNSIHYFSAGNLDYMVITLDYGASDAILSWASKRIEANPYKNVIITTHAYMYKDGTTLDINDNCPPSKDSDGIVYDKASINNGDDMWNKLVSQHPNIVLTLSGHDPCDNLVTSQWKGVNGNVVTNMLIDPQGLDKTYYQEGCAGAVAMFYMSADGKTAEVRFWSTARNCYIKRSNQFTVNLHTIDADYTVLNQKIAALPEVSALTKENAVAVNEANAIYEAMSAENKAKVVNASKLTQAVAKMQDLVSEHTITWVVDGKQSTTTANYGDMPVFSGDTYKYGQVFTGWSPAVSPVTGDATYTAQYSDTSVWDGMYPSAMGTYSFSGQGTKTNPWLIQSATDLAVLSMLSCGQNYGTSSQYYKLTVNVDLSAYDWVPICADIEYADNLWTQWYSFGANFDGDNHTVTLRENSMEFAFGLFGALSGSVSNLIIDGTINATGYTGGLVSVAKNGATITNVVNKANITSFGNQVGGIVGNVENQATVTIKNCANEGNITSTNGTFIAGIVGGGYASVKLENCTNSGNITAAGNVGGIISESHLQGEVKNCTNSGTITAGTTVATEAIGNSTAVLAGTLIGKDHKSYTITWIVDGQESTSTVAAGATPVFNGTPAKAPDAQYTYTFNGWDKTLAVVTENATYTAQFESALRTYTVTWIVDGVETEDTVAYGETPVFDGTPVKEADNEYTYTFSGWDKEVVAVTGNVTYTAEFEQTPVIPDSSDTDEDSSSDEEDSSDEDPSDDEDEDPSDDEEDISSGANAVPTITFGCAGSVGGGLCVVLLTLCACAVFFRKRTNE